MAYPVDQYDVDYAMGTVPSLGVDKARLPGSINQLVRCTYNEAHQVTAARYTKHLQECREMYVAKNGLDMVICPCNPLHHVHQSVLEKHIMICEDYFKYKMFMQEDPPRMMKEYHRNVAILWNDVGADKSTADDDLLVDNLVAAAEYYGCDLDDDSIVLPPSVTLKDLKGNAWHPKTGKEFRRMQKELARKAIQKLDKQGMLLKRAEEFGKWAVDVGSQAVEAENCQVDEGAGEVEEYEPGLPGREFYH